MFAIAISYTDSRGNDKVRAFASNAGSKHEALGEVFMTMTKVIIGDFVVKAWDIADDEVALLAAIEEEVRAGKKIAAIKTLRALTGSTLKEAKVFVDDHYYDWPKDVVDL
jgi:hypothetical protein